MSGLKANNHTTGGFGPRTRREKMPTTDKPPAHHHDQDALSCYVRFMRKAVRFRDGSRDETEPESVRLMRREMMHFYAHLAMTTCSGIRGSIYRV